MDTTIAAVVLCLTYIGVAFTRLPHINIDRPSAAFTGGVLMIALGILTFDEAIEAIDFNTLGLLLGMMALASALKVTGLLELLAVKSIAFARTPGRLLSLVVIATAVASALLVNDAVVLFFTPVIIQACRMRQVDPVPYLIAEVMAANIGSTATIIGNPQNMLIGITSGISFARFTAYLLPVAIVSIFFLIVIIRYIFRHTFRQGFPQLPDSPLGAQRYDPQAVKRLIPILILTVLAFFLSSVLDIGLPLIALCCAAVVLLAGRTKPSTVIREIDWVLLLFFAGLFIVIEGAHKTGLFDVFIEDITFKPSVSGIVLVSLVSTAISQMVSNVPLTMLLLPVLRNVPGHVLWISLAAGSTLGGNLTIIGAIANIIVVESAAKEGIHIGFMSFLKVGALVTAATVGVSILILAGEYWMGWLK